MISAFIMKTVVYLASLLLFWLPTVTELPTISGFDVDGALVSVFSTIHGIMELLPPIAVVVNALVWYYGVMLLLLVIPWIRWIIGLIRGSGS